MRILAPQVDQIMIPHLIKVEPDAFICPKFMGLPDIVSHAIPSVKEKLLIVQVGPHQVNMFKSLKHAAKRLGVLLKTENLSKQLSTNMTNIPALNIIEACQSEDISKKPAKLAIGLLGHPYCLYDACLNLDLFTMLTKSRYYIL